MSVDFVFGDSSFIQNDCNSVQRTTLDLIQFWNPICLMLMRYVLNEGAIIHIICSPMCFAVLLHVRFHFLFCSLSICLNFVCKTIFQCLSETNKRLGIVLPWWWTKIKISIENYYSENFPFSYYFANEIPDIWVVVIAVVNGGIVALPLHMNRKSFWFCFGWWFLHLKWNARKWCWRWSRNSIEN